MIYRDIFGKLEEHLDKKQITVITGMRRVGKTTALKYLLERIKSKNKIYLDLEKVENRYIFHQSLYKDIEISLQIEGINFESKAYIALDEIQLVPEITSVIKYLYDNYNIKFLLTGSSSFYLKNHFTESMAGRKRIFEMFPLSFFEYLHFIGEPLPARAKPGQAYFNITYYQKYKEHYLNYIEFGGFPELTFTNSKEVKFEYIKDIINSHIELDIKLLSDFSKSKDLYNLIRLLSNRLGSKVDYSKLSGILGLHRNKIRDYIDFLEFTYLIRLVPVYTKNADREISKQNKIYFIDSGIAYVLGNKNISQLLENSIASQLRLYGEIKYYAKKTGQEIDFILDNKCAFEVKETPTRGDLNTLVRRSKSIGIEECHIIGLNWGMSGFDEFIWAGSI